jgi:predicted MFS family arabinose efflux permease
MQEPTDPNYRKLKRNLFLLAISRGMVFWYAIDKLFQSHIGITLGQIVLIGVIAQGSKVLFELPTSIVADRWNRRNILLLANASLLVSSVILGFSKGSVTFIIGVLFWSLCDALFSGVYEAFAYDSVATAGYKQQFRRIYTRMSSLDWLSLAFAGVAAGVFSHFFGLRGTFFISVIPILVSVKVLLSMSEPKIIRTSDSDISWIHHLGGAFKLMNSRVIRWTILLFILLFGLQSVWYEYYQLIGVQVKVPITIFGLLLAAMTIGMAIGAEIAHHQPANRKTLLAIWVIVIITHLLGLHFTQHAVVLANFVLAFIALQTLMLYLELHIHDHLESSHRATVFSLATTISYAWFFVLAGLFTIALHRFGARQAFMVASLPFLLAGVIDVVTKSSWAPNKVAPVDIE